mgnify:CR=1 FL=1
MVTTIHRGGMNGGAACGAQGRILISVSGNTAAITCPVCKGYGLSPALEEAIAAQVRGIEEAARSYREAHP